MARCGGGSAPAGHGGGRGAVVVFEGENGEVVEITDTFIGVHPEGALLKVFVDAPSLEDAEMAVEALVEEIFEGCEPWPSGRSTHARSSCMSTRRRRAWRR